MNERTRALIAQPFGPEHPAYQHGRGPISGIINLLTRAELWRRRPLATTVLDTRLAHLQDRLQAANQRGRERNDQLRDRIRALGNPAVESQVQPADQTLRPKM